MQHKRLLDKSYVTFTTLYVALIVASNLIFQKFLLVPFINDYFFNISAGLLAFPITFLITDIICEIYGKKAANLMVFSSFFALLFVVGLVKLSDSLLATEWSPISDANFSQMFGYIDLAFISSALASLLSQFLDITIFHYLKKKTKGKHLWIRNNVSTLISQFIDTLLVLYILNYYGVVADANLLSLFINSFAYKCLFAIADTPFVYLFVAMLKGKK